MLQAYTHKGQTFDEGQLKQHAHKVYRTLETLYRYMIDP